MERARIESIESDLQRIPGVRAARLRVEGTSVRDVQIGVSDSRRARAVVRDVVTALFARHGISLSPTSVLLLSRPDFGRPDLIRYDAPTRTAARADRTAAGDEMSDARLRFRSVNIHREGGIAEAQVELELGARVLIGVARGAAIRRHQLRLVARATLSAIERLFGAETGPETVSWELLGVERRRLSGRAVLMCHVAFLEGSREAHLIGTVFESGDPLEAIALSVLDATNRILPRLHEDDAIEYDVDDSWDAGDREA